MIANNLKSKKVRALTVFILLFVGFGVLIYRVYQLQLRPSKKVEEYAHKQYWRQLVLNGERGIIFDCRGNEVAVSVPVSSIYAVPVDVNLSPVEREWLKNLFGKDVVDKLIEAKKEGIKFLWLKRFVDQNLEKKIRESGIKGIYIVKERKRRYPYGKLASPVIGFTGIDDQGLAGLEYKWEDLLRPKKVVVRLLKDAIGNLISVGFVGDIADLINPSKLELTLDMRFQYVVERELTKAAVFHKAKWACAILMDPNTGFIKAMASWPSFNPNEFPQKVPTPAEMRDNAISMVYEPGSTLKPVIVSVALEENIISLKDKFFCGSFIEYGGKRIRCLKSHGWLSVEEVLINSCNVGAIRIGTRIDPKLLYDYLNSFGFGWKSGIELPGEEKGILEPPSKWYGSKRATICVGQGIAVTPIQLCTAFASVINGGYLVRPHIVKKAISKEGKIVYVAETEIRRQVISRKTSETVRNILEKVVEMGTGKKARIEGIPIGGKTGTAQVAIKGKYVKGLYVSSFIGFMPVDEPKFLLLVVIGQPQRHGFLGGEVAAPVFANIMKDIFRMSKGENPDGSDFSL